MTLILLPPRSWAALPATTIVEPARCTGWRPGPPATWALRREHDADQGRAQAKRGGALQDIAAGELPAEALGEQSGYGGIGVAYPLNDNSFSDLSRRSGNRCVAATSHLANATTSMQLSSMTRR